jgi:murein DD-endopeptidase MepM/ murein hydrolase activator NlpD
MKKYIYDSESLTYIEVQVTLKDQLKKFLPYILSGLFIGIAAYTVSMVAYSTPKEKLQSRQIEELKNNQKVLSSRIEEASDLLSELIILDDSVYRTVLGAKPLPEEIRTAGTGGVNKYEELEKSKHASNAIEAFRRLDDLMAKMKVQEESYADIIKKAAANVDRLKHLPAIIPIANWDLDRVGSGFGQRLHPILNYYRPHEGIDFIAPTGTSVFASADGVVKTTRMSDSYGRVVEIDHGHGIISLYAHLSKFKVKRGQKVVRGEEIGLVGNTGLSAGSHLHYEVHINNQEVDPVAYFFNDLSVDEYEEVVARAEQIQTSMD